MRPTIDATSAITDVAGVKVGHFTDARRPTGGDTIFAVATGRANKPGNPTLLGIMAAEVIAVAVLRAADAAHGIPGLPAARDLRGSA